MTTHVAMDAAQAIEAALLQELLLKHRVENFLARECELLDERKFLEWVELFSEEARYWAPLARNFKAGHPEMEYTRERRDAAWFDEGKATLKQRVQQIMGGDHWAEEPASRTTHLIAGIRIDRVEGDQVTVKSRFVVYSNRNERETQLYVGKRVDVLRRQASTFSIVRREIYLDQHVMTAKSLTTFL